MKMRTTILSNSVKLQSKKPYELALFVLLNQSKNKEGNIRDNNILMTAKLAAFRT